MVICIACFNLILKFSILLKKSPIPIFSKLQTQLFKHLSEASCNSSIITCSTFNDNEEASSLGLRNNHAYTITRVCEINKRKGYHYEKHFLLRIRNPWGDREWIGAWADHSDQMKSLKPRHLKRFGFDLENDGEFYMSISDFVKVNLNE